MQKRTYLYNAILDADGHDILWRCRASSIAAARLKVEAETGLQLKSIHRAAPETRRVSYQLSLAWVDMGQAAK